MTEEPDVPREAGPPDHDEGVSGWLAAALSRRGPAAPTTAGSGDDAPADGSDESPAYGAAAAEQPDPHASQHSEPHRRHLAERARRWHPGSGRSAAHGPQATGRGAAASGAVGSGACEAAAPGGAVGSGVAGNDALPAGPGQAAAGQHGMSSGEAAGQHGTSPSEVAGPHGPSYDDAPGGPDQATGAARGEPEPEQPLSPLGAPPLPATPTGVVRWWTAGATLAAAVLLSVAGLAGVGPLAVAALFVVAVTAWGWPTLVDLPSPRGSTSVVALGGAACVLAVGLSREEPLLQWLALALAGAVVGEFVHQLARRDGRPRLVECVTGTLAGVVVLASMSAWIALPRTPMGGVGVLLVALPVAIGLGLQALPVPGRVASLTGVGVAALLAGLVAGLVPEPTILAGLVTGLVTGAVAVMLHRLLSVLPPAGSAPAWLALALAPLASTGMVGYVALRLLVG